MWASTASRAVMEPWAIALASSVAESAQASIALWRDGLMGWTDALVMDSSGEKQCANLASGRAARLRKIPYFLLLLAQPVFEREQRRAAAGLHPDLGIEILDVVVSGFR